MATEKIEIQRHYVMVRNYHSVALIPVKSVLPFHLSLSLSVYLYLSTPIPLVKFLSDICLPLTPDITVSLSLSHAPPFSVSRIIMLARPLNHLGFLALIASSPHRLYIGLLHRAHLPCSGIYTETWTGKDGPRVRSCICIFILRTYCA